MWAYATVHVHIHTHTYLSVCGNEAPLRSRSYTRSEPLYTNATSFFYVPRKRSITFFTHLEATLPLSLSISLFPAASNVAFNAFLFKMREFRLLFEVLYTIVLFRTLSILLSCIPFSTRCFWKNAVWAALDSSLQALFLATRRIVNERLHALSTDVRAVCVRRCMTRTYVYVETVRGWSEVKKP